MKGEVVADPKGILVWQGKETCNQDLQECLTAALPLTGHLWRKGHLILRAYAVSHLTLTLEVLFCEQRNKNWESCSQVPRKKQFWVRLPGSRL